MPTGTALLRGESIIGNGEHIFATPFCFVTELPSEFTPALFEDGAVQTTFLRNVPAGNFDRAFRASRHVPNWKAFNDSQGVGAAQVVGDAVERIYSSTTLPLVQLNDLLLGYRSRPRAFHLPGEFLLQPPQSFRLTKG